jgi:hypothetical protein
MLKLFSFFTVCAWESTGLELYTLYSGLSGLISSGVKIGSDSQVVRLAINFSVDSSFLIAASLCPPHVPLCFNDTTSTSFLTAHLPMTISGINGLMTGISAVDEFKLGAESIPMTFSLITQWEPQGPALREVGGMIGAGRGSIIFSDQVIAVYDGIPRINGLGIKSVVDMDRLSDMVVSSGNSNGGWIFESLLTIEGSYAGGIIRILTQFDTSEENLVFPVKMKQAIIDKLEAIGISSVEVGGTLLMPCTVFGRLYLDLKVSLLIESVQIDIPTSQLEFQNPSRVGQVGEFRCPVRVRFSSRSRYVIIGRQLVRSVSAVLLDYKLGRIGFRMRDPRGAVLNPVIESRPLVPVYDLPKLLPGNAVVFQQDSVKGSLILGSTKLRLFNYKGQQFACWMMYRIKSIDQPVLQEELAGRFTAMRLKIDRDRILIGLTREGILRMRHLAIVIWAPDSVRVCLKREVVTRKSNS